MHRRKTVYLANPYGFSDQQRTVLLPALVHALEALGLDVWEPLRGTMRTPRLPVGLTASGRRTCRM